MHTWKLSSHQWQSRLFLSVTNDCADYSTSGAAFGGILKICCGYVQTVSLETFWISQLEEMGESRNKYFPCHCLLHPLLYFNPH